MNTTAQQHNRLNQRAIALALAVGFILMAVKFTAWYITGSNAVLTDALESIVNIVAGAFALYSLVQAARPRDANHPYGHGKIEYFAAGVEGGLVTLAGLGMAIKSAMAFGQPVELQDTMSGLGLVAASVAGNGIVGWVLIRQGRRTRSLVLEAEGRHLLSDVITSVGTVAGLGLVMLTGQVWLDSVVAFVMSLVILIMGFRVMRRAVGNLMDEADEGLLIQITATLETNRQHHPQWVDVHHLRVQQFGEGLHIDCHLTLPWYYDLHQTRHEIRALEHLLNAEMPARVEASIRADPCVPQACAFCPLDECPHRQAPFRETLPWTPPLLQRNVKHSIAVGSEP